LKADEQVIRHIKDAFRNCATNGLLTKNQFNQALAVLETLNFKRLRDTPLADRLFVLFDKVIMNLDRAKMVLFLKKSLAQELNWSSVTKTTLLNVTDS
jgi:hypothetical protein